MKKLIDLCKSKKYLIQWTVIYFAGLWCILKYLFNFNMFSAHYWFKFFHASFHGFPAFVFCIIIYSAIPIYIATALVVSRKNSPLFTIPFKDKITEILSKIFPQQQKEPEPEQTPEVPETKQTNIPEYPADLPPELRIPFMRAKQNLRINGYVSVYNKNNTPAQETTDIAPESFSAMLPSDFDISDTAPESDLNPEMNFVPTFTEINFDEPKQERFENTTTKYFDKKNIEYEIYKNFIATEKYVIYEHNDGDFWIMDEDTWFASGKQIDSPINELINLAKQNGLIPVLYLQSQNIMDIENTTNTFESKGVRVIKSLEELD